MKRRNEKQMHKLYIEWLGSGKSKIEFAQENGITKSTFHYWAQKIEKQGLPAAPSPARESGFAPLAIGDSFPSRDKHAVLRINYPSGVSVDLFDVPDPVFLKTLIG